MALYQYAFIERSKVPERDSWQAAIAQCGFDLEFDHDWTPFDHAGFVPCKLPGVKESDSGFELYYGAVAEFAAFQKDDEKARQILDLAQGRDSKITFRWGSNFLDVPCVMIACYALARHFDAIISFECEKQDDPDDILRIAHESLKQAQLGDYE